MRVALEANLEERSCKEGEAGYTERAAHLHKVDVPARGQQCPPCPHTVFGLAPG